MNEQAHLARSKLDQLSTSVGYFHQRADVLHELSLFVRQLTRRDIGITGGGFFVVNKSFILTVASCITFTCIVFVCIIMIVFVVDSINDSHLLLSVDTIRIGTGQLQL